MLAPICTALYKTFSHPLSHVILGYSVKEAGLGALLPTLQIIKPKFERLSDLHKVTHLLQKGN